MSDTQDADAHRTKRFKHLSHNEQLKQVHLPSVLAQTKFDEDIEDTSSQFYTSLIHWLELNLAPSFISFAHKASPLAQSLPLLLHHWREVVQLWIDAVEKADDEALRALFDLMQKLTHDLRSTLLPEYDALLKRLLSYLTRSISPQALTALLSTLSALFKYLLIPSCSETITASETETDLLLTTWSQLRVTMIKCRPEVQRTAAETWALVLRRLRPDTRDRCVKLMLAEQGRIEDALALVFVFATKACVAQTLHTCTPSLITSILEFHLSLGNARPQETEKLLRRILTALVHHCPKAQQFAEVGDLLVERFDALIGDSATSEEVVRRMLEVMSVPCAVRKGSRLTHKQLSQILSVALQIRPLESMHSPLLKLTVAPLVSSESDVSLWMGPGRRVIDHAWTSSSHYALLLIGVLAEAQWAGFKQFALPPTLKNLSLSAEHDEEWRLRMLRLLAKLATEGMLESVDKTWKEGIETWVSQWLESFTLSEASVATLREILLFSHILRPASVIPGLVVIARNMLQSQSDPREAYDLTWANEAWVFGASLRQLANIPPEEVVKYDLKMTQWLGLGLQKWAWSEAAMTGLVEMTKRYDAREQGCVALDDVYVYLKDSLMTHTHILRLNTLQLLSSPIVECAGCDEVLKRCLAAEQIPLSVQGVRERMLLTSRVTQVVQDGEEKAADICARWLLSQFKVNLRPLWNTAAHAIASLAQRFPDVVWSLVFHELESLSHSGSVKSSTDHQPPWCKSSADAADGEILDDDVQEEERTWRDPSAFKLRVAIKTWIMSGWGRNAIIEDQTSRERLDTITYETQLLAALGEYPSLAERHSRELIPLFLSFTSPDLTTKPSRTKLMNWLSLFAKFLNPKALHNTSDIHALYVSLLGHPDRALQTQSLTCLLTYKSPALLPHEDRLRALLDDLKWRDEMALLEMDKLEVNDRVELVPVMIRLFFGMMLEKRGHGKGANRRAAVLSALGACHDHELDLLVELMLEPFSSVSLHVPLQQDTEWVLPTIVDSAPEKQQIGFLTLLDDVLRNLGTRLVKKWPQLLTVTLALTARAQRKLETVPKNTSDPSEPVDDEIALDDEEIDTGNESLRSIRAIRQLGLKRLTDFFRCPVAFDFHPYIREVFRTIISPRIPNLAVENTQSPSAMMELFHVWTHHRETAMLLVQYDNRTLPKIYDCLIATNVKAAVLSRIFDMVERLLALSSNDDEVSDSVVKPYMGILLSNLAVLVQRTPIVSTTPNNLPRRQIVILSEIAPYLTDGTQAATLLSLFTPLLRKPAKTISEKVKADMLKIVSNILPLIPDLSNKHSTLYSQTYDTFSQLFQILRGRQARVSLNVTFQQWARLDTELASLADLLESLNAFSTKRMDEPDFDRRLDAFTTLNENLYKTFTPKDWSPVLYNMLNFIQDENELSIRNNASLSMKRFIEILSKSDSSDYLTSFLRILFPGLKRGLRSKYELVRAEVLGVIAYAVTQCDNVTSLHEMRVLLAGGDEEANFFNNIHHIQVHRRNRALRRLADNCDEVHFRSSTLADIFVPLVGSFVLASQTTDHHLVNEAVLTIGRIAKHLSWGAYYSLVQQYLKLSTEKGATERALVRTLVAILDNFHFPMDSSITQVDSSTTDPHESVSDDEDMDSAKITVPASVTAKIADVVNDRLLPNLLKHLEQRSEMEDSVRIPIAVGIAKVAQHLPEVKREAQISRLLTILCQILRSKSQETRDLTRETLCRIVASLGTSYIAPLIREMRMALLRGPQLHVLAFVTHSLLVFVTSPERVQFLGNIDACVPDIVHISAEVIFGQSGKDVLAEEFKTKMREVRGSTAKGMDSFAILAKHITPSAMTGLLLPIKAIMQETESLKTTQQMDEILRRISGGLNGNAQFGPAELLVLCHTLISQNARFLKESHKPQNAKRKPKNDTIVQLKRRATIESDHYAHNSFRFVSFGLDLFNTAYRRGRFDFQDVKVISRLEPMVSVIGNTLYSSEGQIISLGLKATANIVKCPLKSIGRSLPVFVRQTLDIVKQAGSTDSDVVQTAFKSLAVIIRDCPSAQVKEKDLTYLLELLSPDLEEPTRQSPAFTLLRAIISRKFVVPEIYDLMDQVSEIMVRSQSSQVQELCRGVLLQFLLDYPQGKGRLKQQITFLAKNLSYVFESGRLSVMELLNAVMSKFQDELIREYADLLFIALVMVIANDDAPKCREMAAQLIKILIGRLGDAQRRVILSHAHSWATQQEQPALARVSAQVYGLIVDALQTDASPYLAIVLEDVNAKLQTSIAEMDSLNTDESNTTVDYEWQTPYQALSVISKIFSIFPATLRQHDKVSWPSIVHLLLYPHAWVRTASCRLLGSLFSVYPVSLLNTQLPNDLPLSVAGMKDVAKALCTQLKSVYLDEALGVQIVKNLFYIGKCYSVIWKAENALELKNDLHEDRNEGDDEENNAEEGIDEEQKVDPEPSNGGPLPWLFSRLSYQARSAHIARRSKFAHTENWTQQPAAILRWFAAMTSHMTPVVTERYLPHMLSPIYRIIEDDTIRDPQMEELKTLALELQDLVQSKVGTTKFANVYNRIRQSVIGVRRERRTARVMQATTNPEAMAKRKMQRNAGKKESRKRKTREFTETKIRNTFAKRRRQD